VKEIPEHPEHINANCPICGTQLVLLDVLRDPYIKAADIWTDEWVCPAHTEEGVHMDWPPEEIERLKQLAEVTEATAEVADFTPEGGMRIMATPEVFETLMTNPDFPLEEMLDIFREMRPES